MKASGKDASARAASLLAQCERLRLAPCRLRQLPAYTRLLAASRPDAPEDTVWRRYRYPLLAAVLAVLAAAVFRLELYNTAGLSRLVFALEGISEDVEQCTIDMPSLLIDLTTKPVNCDLCADIRQVERVSNITPEEFETKYAYSGRPVVVIDGTANWTAPQVFSFEFFRELYEDDSPVIEGWHKGCQFFPYKTTFRSLAEVFSMSEERANMKPGEEPWYIGWSNCDSMAANILRQHYRRPYFLPETSESSRLDWIFMGTPGFGANMHIDHVQNPSWQAQLAGKKLWTLEPPHECRSVCPKLQVTVNPGEIIVLDTNMWYHMTEIVSDNISITIGSEYD